MRKILDTISSYKTLFILWLVVGIVTLAGGSISRVGYLCVWLVLLMELATRVMEEKK